MNEHYVLGRLPIYAIISIRGNSFKYLMRTIMVTDYSPDGWADSAAGNAYARRYCEQLEQGAILQLPPPLVDLSADDRAVMASIGVPIDYRSPYYRFMLRFHDYLKMNADFQANCPSELIEFSAGSTWIAFTYAVSHAVLSGQYALEQTFCSDHFNDGP